MRKINYTLIAKAAPCVMAAGMGCFIAAHLIDTPCIKNTLLFTGLGAVVASIILYCAAWKNEGK